MMDRFLELYRLGKTYPTPQGPAVIVEEFTTIIREGEFVCLIGHSGCGKSTVLNMVAGLIDRTVGDVVLAGKITTDPGPDRGVVFQSPNLLPWMTALENVLLGVQQVYPHATRSEQRDIAQHYLSKVGLGNSLHKKPSELSQGMRQRVGLARAFALRPKVLLLDEPFGMLDQLTRMELQEVLIELCAKDQKTALMVTHDVDEAIYLSDRVIMMTTGPRATIGKVMTVDFSRPRNRQQMLDSPHYYELREQLIEFLESQDHRKAKPSAA